jgi:hypothetical protein
MGFEIPDTLQETLKEFSDNPEKYSHILPSIKSVYSNEPFWLSELKCSVARKRFWRYLKYKISKFIK